MSRSLRTPPVRESRIGPSSPVLISTILLALLGGLLGYPYDGKAAITEPNAAPNLTMHSNGKFYAKNNSSPATLWFPTGPGDPEDFLCRSPAEHTSIVDMLNGGNTLYVMAVKTHGGDGPAECNPWIGGNPTNGLDTAKLNDWYNVLDQADNKGVVIHFFIYDDDSCPWGTKTSCEARTWLQTDESEFLNAFVDRFKTLSNLVWVVAEEYPEAVRDQRATAIAARIQSRDTVHPVGIHQQAFDTSFNFPNNNNFDVFLMQMGTTVRSSQAVHDTIVKEYNASAGRYGVVLAELSVAPRFGSRRRPNKPPQIALGRRDGRCSGHVGSRDLGAAGDATDAIHARRHVPYSCAAQGRWHERSLECRLDKIRNHALRPKELRKLQDAGVLGNLHQLSLSGRHQSSVRKLPSDVDEHRKRNKSDANDLVQRRRSHLWRSPHQHRCGVCYLGKALATTSA